MKKKAKVLKRKSGETASKTGSTPDTAEASNGTVAAPTHINVEDDNTDENSDGLSKGRKRSKAWQHFTEYIVYEDVMVDGVLTQIKKHRATCKHCKIADYAVNRTTCGTSQMLKHFRTKCPVLLAKGQTVLAGDNSTKNTMTFKKFNQKHVMAALIEMIVIDEMPFSTVEKPGFRKFCSIAVSEFRIPSRRLFVREFLKTYVEEKSRLKKELSKHRLSLTTDIWTSVQNMSYMVVTAHFVDHAWKMHKRILSFCQVPNHQGITIGKLIESCLVEWGIDKILAITVDNASANKSALEWLKSKLNNWENSKAILGSRFLHVRCLAHIVNLIVGDGLKVLNKSILAIRNAVSFVRSSTHRLAVFKAAVEAEKIPCKALVVLDVSTRWNSTYMMLQAALRFKKAFDVLGEDDSSYKCYFKEPSQPEDDPEGLNDHLVENALGMDISIGCIAPTTGRKRVGPQVDLDWEKAKVFVDFLKLFYEITLRISANLKPTIHTAFHDILGIQKKLSELYVPVLDQEKPRSELEQVLTTMSEKMDAKYKKYFGNYKDANELVLIGLALDPRFKLKYLEHVFANEGHSEAEVRNRISDLKSLLKKLYDCYKPPESIEQSYFQSEPNSSISRISDSSSNYSGLTVFSNWTKKGGSLNLSPKHEVDKYLDEEVDDYIEGVEIDILMWWKVNSHKYSVLASIAKDVLAVQVSTVASESVFSTGGRIIDCTRSSLTPKSAEALICLQNWLRGDDIITKEDEPSIETHEFYESCESEITTAASSAASSC